MLARIGITILLMGVGFGAYTAGTRWQTQRIQTATNPVLDGLLPGIPAVIYFWSETCPPCKTMQKPALEQLVEQVGDDAVQVIAINALEEQEIADQWGVLGLPTTFIVDAAGQPRHVNHGLTRAEQLKQQLETFG